MNPTFRKIVTVVAILIPLAALATGLKVWNGTETIQSADLNSNFTTVNTAATASITNARISSAAAIATSKLAAYRYIPRTWVTLLQANASCGIAAGACTETTPGSASVTGLAVGSYLVTLGYTATDTTYAVSVTQTSTTGFLPDAGIALGSCYPVNLGTTTFGVTCRENSANINTDMGFNAVVYDDN